MGLAGEKFLESLDDFPICGEGEVADRGDRDMEILVKGGTTVVGIPGEGKYFEEMLLFVVVIPP